MWTAKRVLLLGLGFAVFLTAFAVYAFFLGRFDGLRPLPEKYQPRESPGFDAASLPPPVENPADRKLIMAFGDGCPEIKRPIKLEVGTRRLVLTADQYEIVKDDGRLKLWPFSVAIFGKETGQMPEINTIRCDEAYLRFDRPISNPSEMGTKKLVGIEFVGDSKQHTQGGDPGGVTFRNNRRSAQRGNELMLFTPGPVWYEEARHQIWTDASVHVKDLQNKPKPTEITAIGMDVYLSAEAESSALSPRRPSGRTVEASKNKTPSVGGVDRIVLRSNVDMYLWVDARSGFLGPVRDDASKGKSAAAVPEKATAGPAASAKPANAAEPEKAQVVISTQGPFAYDLRTDHARFDILQQHEQQRRPDQVLVTRRQKPDGPYDQLVCEHLEMQFQRKSAAAMSAAKPAGAATPATPSVPREESSVALEMQSAHAWAEGGREVVLTSDAEVLTALGNDLVYDAATRITTLKGNTKITVLKDGNQIDALELELVSMGDKGGQQANIKGPGEIGMLDPSTKQRTQKARWKDMLISTKEGAFDVLLLTGDAVFEDVDKDHPQQLKADRLKVWLHPGEDKNASKPAPGTAAAASEAQRRRPHHLEATGNVKASSAEMNVHHTDRLIVWFKDVPPTPPAKPAIGTPAPGPETTHTTGKPVIPNSAPALAPAVTASTAARSTAAPAVTAAPKAKKPIDVSARSVEAHVRRIGNKNELDHVTCEGSVKVHQDPEAAQPTPEDKGVDIRGDTLHMTRFPEGNVLLVTGEPADVNMEKLSIQGPEVHIDQKENTVRVNGLGSMKLPSNTTFQGNKLAKPSELKVNWNKDMLFDGKYAEFHGGVQAEQDAARLACQSMQVFLDRFVSLKEGDKGKAPAKVEKLVCDKNVWVEDTTREKGRFVEYKRIRSIELSVDNEFGLVNAPGPGVVYILRPGPQGEALPAQAAPKGKANEKAEELKLTRVTYFSRMSANNTARTVNFYDDVEVVHLAANNPDVRINLDKLPPDALHVKCQMLKVYTSKQPNGTTSQQMEAHHKAWVHTQEFWGVADVIKYDESKDQVVFEASEGNLATLYRIRARGLTPEKFDGKKIIYDRKTNLFRVEDGTKIDATLINGK